MFGFIVTLVSLTWVNLSRSCSQASRGWTTSSTKAWRSCWRTRGTTCGWRTRAATCTRAHTRRSRPPTAVSGSGPSTRSRHSTCPPISTWCSLARTSPNSTTSDTRRCAAFGVEYFIQKSVMSLNRQSFLQKAKHRSTNIYRPAESK